LAKINQALRYFWLRMIKPFLEITGKQLQGTLSVPPSKSMMQRVLAITLMRNSNLEIVNPGFSEDDQVMLKILANAGYRFKSKANGSLSLIAPELQRLPNAIHFGESGLASRMLIPILSLFNQEFELSGDAPLNRRPMPFLRKELPSLGVQVSPNDGYLPVHIHGPLKAIDLDYDGSLGSQFLSGLIIAYGYIITKETHIRVHQLKSKPYIDMTLKVMDDLNLNFPDHEDYQDFSFFPSSIPVRQLLRYEIEGDWSAAAFWLVAGTKHGPVTVRGIDCFSTQADRAILLALMDAGANISVEQNQVTVRPSKLNAFHFNAIDCPDLFPPLAVLATFAEGTSVIAGIGRLIHKESNRASTIQTEFQKMGVEVTLQDDLMIIKGAPIQAAALDAHGDHRIAMMGAIAALGTEGIMSISGYSCVAKSYPDFFKDYQKLGGKLVYSE